MLLVTLASAAIVLVRGADLPPPPLGNELEAPTVRIDPVLRSALLKALSNLEKESDELGGTTTENFFTSTTASEELLEESTSSDRLQAPPAVHFTAFTFDRNSSESDPDDNTIYKTVIVPKTTLSPPRQAPAVVFSDPDPVKLQDIHIETVQVARSVATSIQANDIKEGSKVSDKVLALSKSALTSTSAPATTTTSSTTTSSTGAPTPTTTTTEAPVTNADGENIEKANDVQIHQAPLVAAFTVQQDAQGLPKSVMPIFKQLIDPAPQQPLRIPNQGPINFGINPYHFALEAQERELVQRIQYLQNQQRQQEQLYRQQQEQVFFEQRFRAEEEQRLRQRFEQEQRFRLQGPFAQQQQQLPLPLVQLPQRTPPVVRSGPGAPVQVIPSVSLSNNNNQKQNQINGLPSQQQLPVKDAGTFKISSEQQLPFLQNAGNFHSRDQIQAGPQILGPLQLRPQLQLPQRPFVPFNTQVNIVPSLSAQLKNNNIEQGLLPPFEVNQQSLTRVFRHENNPSFEQQKSQQIYVPPQASAQNLQQLLFQSGVAGRSNEDLNIITRVLALNHGINTNFINHNGGPHRQNFV